MHLALDSAAGRRTFLGSMRFVIRWIATSLAVIVAALLSGTHVENWTGLAGVAFFVGFCNAIARPILLRVATAFVLPALVVTILVINLALLGGINWLPELRIPSLGNGLLAALVVSAVSCAFSIFFRDRQGRVHLISYHPLVQGAPAEP
jgi:uncharacterized membrane protein YvlD (DUF360 family)